MILMQAPGAGLVFSGTPSSSVYVSDPNSLIYINNNSVADQTYLMGRGCFTLSPFGGWGTYGFTLLADLYAADAASNLVLTGVTGFPLYTVASVFKDGGNSGFWNKTGTGSGAGNWSQVSTGTPASIAAIATLAMHYAMDSTNADVPGGVAGDRGSKYWSIQSSASASASGASASASAGSASSASTALSSISSILASSASYATKAAANAALSGLAANAFAQVWVDESRNNRWAVYQKVSGVYVFVCYPAATPNQWYVDPKNGSDSNAGTTAAPFQTPNAAYAKAQAGDTIWYVPGAVIKYATSDASGIDTQNACPDYVNHRSLGGKTLWMGFDKVTGAWTAESGAYYKDITHLFGGISAKAGAGRLYPNIIYRTAAGQPWRQLQIKTLTDVANDAAGIAFVQANKNWCYIQDNSGGGSCYGAGWQRGSFRYHINLGADPSGYQWMVLQRGLPFFGYGGIMQDQKYFGGVGHDGLVIRGAELRRVEVSFQGSHACEITGCTTEDFVVRDSRLLTGGYAMHHFGASALYSRQIHSRHLRPQVINWGGAVLGCHSGDSADGGGGAGVVGGEIVMESPYFENVNGMGNGGAILSGVTFNNPVFLNASCGFGGWGTNVVINNPRIVCDGAIDDITVGGGSSIFGSPAVGTILTVNGGSSAGGTRTQGFGMNGGAMVVNNHRMVAGGQQNLIYNTAANQGLTLNNCVIQGDAIDDRTTLSLVYGTNDPVNLNGCHIAGFSIPASPYVVNVDEHSFFGGDTGLSRTDDPNNPVLTSDDSTWFGVGERILNATFPWQRNVIIATSKGLRLGYGQGAAISTLAWAVPAGFTLRGVAGDGAGGARIYAYGLGGKVYFNTSTDPNALNFTAITTGVTINFVSHLVDAGNLFLFGDDGSITKIVVSSNTVSTVTSPIAGAGNKVRSGLVVSTGANLIAVWAKDDESAGGIIYSTDGGTTWSANATSGLPFVFRCLALVNSVVVAAGDDHAFWTCATVGGTFVQLTTTNVIGTGSGNFHSLVVDATRKQLGYVSRGTTSQGAIGRYFTKQAMVGWIDCSNATPANWVLNSKPKPIRNPLHWVLNYQPSGLGDNVYYSMVGAGLQMVDTTRIDGFDYRFSRARNKVPYARRLPDLSADLAYTLS